jgi:outer membrane lipoprotein-sorting protein
MGKSWKAIVCMMILMAVPVLCRASGLDSVKKTYAGINTLDAKFHQKLFIENIKKTREFDGEFSCKRGKGFLWRYTSPKTKYFLFDGQYMWQGEGKIVMKKNKQRKNRRYLFRPR